MGPGGWVSPGVSACAEAAPAEEQFSSEPSWWPHLAKYVRNSLARERPLQGTPSAVWEWEELGVQCLPFYKNELGRCYSPPMSLSESGLLRVSLLPVQGRTGLLTPSGFWFAHSGSALGLKVQGHVARLMDTHHTLTGTFTHTHSHAHT